MKKEAKSARRDVQLNAPSWSRRSLLRFLPIGVGGLAFFKRFRLSSGKKMMGKVAEYWEKSDKDEA